MSVFTAVVFVGVTVGIYLLMKRIYLRWKTPWLSPIVTAGTVVVLSLLWLGIPYEAYMTGGRWIEGLLGPAVVAFAYPLYRQRELLKYHGLPILAGVLTGALVALIGSFSWAHLLGLDLRMIHTLIPQSVTTPVAMDLSRQWGGVPTLTAVLVILAGVVGAVGGPFLYKWLRVEHTLGQGIGFGSAAHGIGTSRAMEEGEAVGAVSTVAMTLAAVLTALLGPLLIRFIG